MSRPRRARPAAELAQTARRRVAAVRPPLAGWVPDRPPGTSPPQREYPPAASSSAKEEEQQQTRPPWVPRDPRRPAAPSAERAALGGNLLARLAAVVPPTVRDGRFALTSRAVAGLAAVAVLAAVLAAGYVWRARGEPVGQAIVPRTVGGASPTRSGSTGPPGAAGPATSAGPAAAAGPAGAAGPGAPPVRAPGAAALVADPAATPTPARLLVHVAGQVRRPGVVELEPGARVADAVAAAGGPAARADLDALNLARPLVDGEQVRVLAPGETPPAIPPGPPGASARTDGTGGVPGETATEAAVVDVNAATLEQLEALPGVGPVLAQRILDWRAEHGGFRTLEELQDVSGIGPSRYAEIAPRVRL